MIQEMIQFSKVVKAYKVGTASFKAADEVSFEIKKGEFAVILGPSGAGKSTVLNLLGGMDKVTSGTILIDGLDITKLDENGLTKYRREAIGFVFQFYNLIPNLTAYENVALTKALSKKAFDPLDVLKQVGLGTHSTQFPAQLSGGEQQRVSIARAVCKNPKLLLCDEPTGALDSETGILILTLLQKMCKEQGHTIVIVTHNAALAEAADRVIKMKNGSVVSQVVHPNPKKISEVSW